MKTPRPAFVASIVLTAAAIRLLPHPWNFTPIGAMALSAGAQFPDRRLAFAIPFTALILGDVAIGWHSLMPAIYGCFAFTVCLGFWVRRRTSASRIIIASLMSSTVFFLVTNFAVWKLLETYPPDSAGLLACYIAGLPLFRNGLLGDLLYSALLFGGLAFAERTLPALRQPLLHPAS